MKIAIPTTQGCISQHFGHCETFNFYDVEEGKIIKSTSLTPPPHEPGVLPVWLGQQGADVIIAGGMGARAQQLLEGQGIEVVIGITDGQPEMLIEAYLGGNLCGGANLCDH